MFLYYIFNVQRDIIRTLLYKETSNLLKYKFIIIKNLYDAIASMKNVRSIVIKNLII